ncbi:MAG: thiamine phosphate synthase [Kordiimonadaceae bacterium]|nr:thiamine phosphate synthase [Kordiimonadaceae bacterium]
MTDNDEGCGLYLITPAAIPDVAAFAKTLAGVLATGAVSCVQLRLKDVENSVVESAAALLLPVCHQYDVPLLINDYAELAAKVGADGVHLGQEDGDVAAARTLLGADKEIGVTCHSSRHLGFEAGEAGANYVAFGAFFESHTKTDATLADKEVLTIWDEVTDIACVAIGGITPTNCKELADAGAHFVAVCDAVWAHSEGPEKAVLAFQKALL